MLHLKVRGSLNEVAEKSKKLIGVGKIIQKVDGPSKLGALFKHPLYNLPQPELQQDDWLMTLKTEEDAKDTESQEEENEDIFPDDSEW